MDPPRLQDPGPRPYADGEICVAEATASWAAAPSMIYHWVHTGQMTARRSSGNRLCIPWDNQARAGCQELDRPVRPPGPLRPPSRLPAPPSPAAEGEVSVTEAAYQLGCSIRCHLRLDRTGKLAARRGAGNRLHIPWNEQVQANAVPGSSNPGTSTPQPARPGPRRPALRPRKCQCQPTSWHHQRPPRPAPIPKTEPAPARDCRRGSMNRPSPR